MRIEFKGLKLWNENYFRKTSMLNIIPQRFIQPAPPQFPPNPGSRRSILPRPPKMGYVADVYKMTKVLEDEKKMGKKSIFQWDFYM